MVLALLISIGVLIICLWLAVMHAWWRNEEHDPTVPFSSKQVFVPLAVSLRLIRRTWYRATHWSMRAGLWGSKKASAAFVKVFPQSAQAFVKRDTMTGLTEGPSSYFLKSISEETPKPKKTRRTSKIV